MQHQHEPRDELLPTGKRFSVCAALSRTRTAGATLSGAALRALPAPFGCAVGLRMTETAIPAAPCRGDESELFSELADRLVRVVSRQVDAPGWVVEDACQFAWVQLLRVQPEREFVFAWLRTTAVREVWSQAGRFGRDVSLDVPVGGWPRAPSIVEALPGPCPETVLGAREALRDLAGLGSAQRYAVSRRVAGLSREEICRESGLTARQVDRHLMKARRALRD
jgi:DNA-directed RNA polymerase specialized sigma24 family protein